MSTVRSIMSSKTKPRTTRHKHGKRKILDLLGEASQQHDTDTVDPDNDGLPVVDVPPSTTSPLAKRSKTTKADSPPGPVTDGNAHADYDDLPQVEIAASSVSAIETLAEECASDTDMTPVEVDPDSCILPRATTALQGLASIQVTHASEPSVVDMKHSQDVLTNVRSQQLFSSEESSTAALVSGVVRETVHPPHVPLSHGTGDVPDRVHTHPAIPMVQIPAMQPATDSDDKNRETPDKPTTVATEDIVGASRIVHKWSGGQGTAEIISKQMEKLHGRVLASARIHNTVAATTQDATGHLDAVAPPMGQVRLQTMADVFGKAFNSTQARAVVESVRRAGVDVFKDPDASSEDREMARTCRDVVQSVYDIVTASPDSDPVANSVHVVSNSLGQLPPMVASDVHRQIMQSMARELFARARCIAASVNEHGGLGPSNTDTSATSSTDQPESTGGGSAIQAERVIRDTIRRNITLAMETTKTISVQDVLDYCREPRVGEPACCNGTACATYNLICNDPLFQTFVTVAFPITCIRRGGVVKGPCIMCLLYSHMYSMIQTTLTGVPTTPTANMSPFVVAPLALEDYSCFLTGLTVSYNIGSTLVLPAVASVRTTSDGLRYLVFPDLQHAMGPVFKDIAPMSSGGSGRASTGPPSASGGSMRTAHPF